MRKYWRVIVLGLVVSAAAIWMIFRDINPALLWDALQAAFTPSGLLWFAAGALLAVGGLGVRAVRWRILLSGGLPLVRAFHILNIAYLVNGVLPLRAGE
ncbi:MAG: flippase-like domain-containing protein, partial [Armatimonadetes bacterium]|nr:flippase-like domain-containing protein [Anaerolineae bacterium]